jgi:T1SS-143 domain-containing protein
MAVAPFEAIGKVQTAIGQVTITSDSGVVAHVKVGDPVRQHDMIDTGADGVVGITFVDGTAFKLSNNARMVLTEFVCAPNGTSSSTFVSVSQGAFSFVAGKVAKTGGLTIDTPIARIRGTSQAGGLGILTLAALTFSAMNEIQAASRPDVFLDDDTITPKDLPYGTFTILNKLTGEVTEANDPTVTYEFASDGSVTRTPKTASQVEQGATLAQQVASLSPGQGAASGGSSTPTLDIPLQLQPINFSPPANNEAASPPIPIQIIPTTSGSVEVIQLKAPPPVLAADAGSHPVIEFLNTTGSSTINVAPAVTLSFTDLKLSAVSASLASITWSGGATLPSELSTVLASALTASASTDSTGFSGSVNATFSAADNNFDFLAANETLTVVYDVTATDSNGVSVTQPVTVTINGTNDAPALQADASGPHTVAQGLNSTGTLIFTDVDLNDHHTVSTSVASATWSGGDTLPSGLAAALAGALSTTQADSAGSGSGSIAFTFSADDSTFNFLAASQTLTIIYEVTVTDNNGVNSTQPITITVTGTNDAPVATITPTIYSAIEQVSLNLKDSMSVSDVDSLGGVETATLSVTEGTLTVTAGTSGAVVSGSGTNTVIVTGTLAQINALLNTDSTSTVSYIDATDSPSASATLTLSINDNGLGGGAALTGSDTAIINIGSVNDAPVLDAHSGSLTYTENQAATAIDTAIAVSDVDSANLAGATVEITRNFVSGQDVLGFTNQDGIVGTYNAATGVLTLTGQASVPQYQAALQSVTYFNSSDNPSSLTRTITYQVNDGAAQNNLSNVVTATVAIAPVNDAPVITSGAAAARVSEEGLTNGVPDTLPVGLDTTNSASASGTITASDADVDPLTMTLGIPTGSLTSGGVAIAWTLQDSNHTLVGKAGTTTIITATITNSGAYTVTLNGPIDHPVANQEDINTFTVPVGVSDGHTTTPTTLSVTIEDDSPKAAPVEVSVDTTDSKTNVMLILDVSGSMDSPSGVPGFTTRLVAAKAAINELLDQYDSRGDVRVQIVKFSTNASQVGTDWMSVADAKAAIAGLSVTDTTNYDAALLTAMDIFTHVGKLGGPDAQNVSYFLSDGEPTTSSDWPQIPGLQSQNGIQLNEQGVWETFLTTNNIVSFALGISNGAPQTANLDPIAFDPASGTQLADTPIIVTDLGQLANALVFTIPPVTGSVLSGAGGATSNSFGADGGYVQSITADGVTYTFNPTANGGAGGITTSDGSSPTYNGTTKTLTIDTDPSVVGGELTVVMTTGAFTFQPPTDFSSETVGYVLVDRDGDTANSMLHFSAAVLPAGVAGTPINLGLTDPADYAIPITVRIAGVPSGWTLSEGTANDDGSWTIQTGNISALSITSPDNYTGAMALQVTMSWTNADDSSGVAKITDNVEVFAQGAPISAWSGDDHLTGSSGKDLFVFARPIGHDTIYSFNASEDQIDLIGYAGFTSFDDVQRHLVGDKAGNAVITLTGGQSIALLGVAASSLTASNFVFDQTPVLNNSGTITLGDGALLPVSGIINNAGTITLDSAGNETHLQLIQYGMTLQGGGQLVLSDSGENFISGTIPSVTLSNADNTISGAGQLGAGEMALVNNGIIIATGSHALIIDTGANVVTNTGTLEASGSGGLIVNGDVTNVGLIWAYGGNITINGAVTGSGSAMISGAATIEFGAASSANITFATDAAGTLMLDHSLAQPFSGLISGLGVDDAIDLKDLAFASGHMTATTSFANGNTTLVVSNTSTNQSATFTLAGDYTHSTWEFAQDPSGTGTIFRDTPATAAATVSDSTSSDLALTVGTALTTQDGAADQFAFQSDSQSSTLAGSTLVASANPNGTNAATVYVPADSAGDVSLAPITETVLASNAATSSQLAAADFTQVTTTAHTSVAPAALGIAGDSFVFAPDFGNVTLTNFDPDTDVIEIDRTEFADFQALLAVTQDDGNGDAVVTADTNDMITIKNVTVAQLVQHQGDFHLT